MKKATLIVGIVVVLSGLGSLAMAMERQTAISDTKSALEIIDAGLDWDGQTQISMDQQTDRMNANVAILAHQKGQRNSRGAIGLVLVTAGVVAVLFNRNNRSR